MSPLMWYKNSESATHTNILYLHRISIHCCDIVSNDDNILFIPNILV